MDRFELNVEGADLSNCDREPIHIPGKIQGHGFIVALDDCLVISHCSENVNRHLGVKAEQLLGKPVSVLEDLLKLHGKEILVSQLIKTGTTLKGFLPLNPYPVYIQKQYYNLILSRSGEFFILEFEPDFSDIETDIRHFIGSSISEMLIDAELSQLLQNTACQIKKIIGYDRVMIYKFHEDGHGEVVAEAKSSHLNTWLRLRYPASDIPKQARELYKINRIRLIANVHEDPSGIVSIIDTDLHPLDLTYVGLRAVSPVHVQYLKNMGVESSFSISLMDKNELWGLVACHNYSARFINYKEREAAKLIGEVLSSALSFRKNKEDEAKKYRLKLKVEELIHQLSREDDLKLALVNGPTTILDAVDACGAVLIYDREIHVVGKTPPIHFVLEIVQWLQLNTDSVLFSSDRFPMILPECVEYKESCSGILSCRINRELEEYLIWFRPEVITTIHWAGNPEKAINGIHSNTAQISPRTSFEVWSEQVSMTAISWKSEDEESAMRLREEIIFTINKKATELRIINEKLKLAYDELTTFSYTISHDLRNPLSSINGFAQLLLSEPQSDPAERRFMHERILANTKKMDLMIIDILKYSQAGSQPITKKQIDLQPILEEIRQELIIGTNIPHLEIGIGRTPAVTGDRLMITQIFSNLVGNAVKYSSKVARPCVHVHGERKEDGILYVIRDNGIGIEPGDINKIFDLFSRLDSASGFKGTGVGLAIVKRLVNKHEGEIWVESVPGSGTSFHILFKN